MKLATYIGDMIAADFEENTITFKIEGDFSVKAGKYYTFSPEALQIFADKICEKQRELCLSGWVNALEGEFADDIILNADQPNIEDL